MEYYIVLYRDHTLLPADAPLTFRCVADDTDHAEEQFMDAYPDCDIVWVVNTDNVESAYDDYYSVGYWEN